MISILEPGREYVLAATLTIEDTTHQDLEKYFAGTDFSRMSRSVVGFLRNPKQKRYGIEDVLVDVGEKDGVTRVNIGARIYASAAWKEVAILYGDIISQFTTDHKVNGSAQMCLNQVIMEQEDDGNIPPLTREKLANFNRGEIYW